MLEFVAFPVRANMVFCCFPFLAAQRSAFIELILAEKKLSNDRYHRNRPRSAEKSFNRIQNIHWISCRRLFCHLEQCIVIRLVRRFHTKSISIWTWREPCFCRRSTPQIGFSIFLLVLSKNLSDGTCIITLTRLSRSEIVRCSEGTMRTSKKSFKSFSLTES